jgi:hypothetical protein
MKNYQQQQQRQQQQQAEKEHNFEMHKEINVIEWFSSLLP